MSEQDDMAVPVTRGELRYEIAKLDRKLELWGGAVSARFERFERRMDGFEIRVEKRFDALEGHLHADFARFAKAIGESVAQAITVIDEKYKDLPGRVAKLERRTAPRRRR
jgi:hypothetical protein